MFWTASLVDLQKKESCFFGEYVAILRRRRQSTLGFQGKRGNVVLEWFLKCAGQTVWPRPFPNMDIQISSDAGRVWFDRQTVGCHGAALQIQEDVD